MQAPALQRRLHRWRIATVRPARAAWPVAMYRYELPPALPWAGMPGRLVVPLGKVTTAVGFSFALAGWHPHVETLRWLAAEPGAPLADSPLGRLYAAFHPRTVREAILDDVDGPVPGLPETSLVRGQLRDLWNPFGARGHRDGEQPPLDRPGLYWGPAPPEHLASEVERTRGVLDSLGAAGYRDDGPGSNPITGYLLVRGEDYRVVAHQGHHRLACLAVLGYDSVPVYLTSRTAPVVAEDELPRWSEGRHPRYTPESARLLFGRLFDSTGREKAARLGILGD